MMSSAAKSKVIRLKAERVMNRIAVKEYRAVKAVKYALLQLDRRTRGQKGDANPTAL